jgi:LmbE family N-acetylglucosaminyl deacetylase
MFQNESEWYPFSAIDLSSKDALIIAPHPDDESMGCGGSISRHIKAGSRVKVIFLTNGDKGDFKGRFGKDYVKIRQQSAQRAMDIFGVKDFEFWGYGDRELQSVFQELRGRLLHTIETFSPFIIYAPSSLEAHPDHKVAFEIVWDLRKKFGNTLAFYEVLMAMYPNILVDITGEMEQKKKALESYFTEAYYNDYVTKVEGLNRFRTATLPKDIKYAEAFVLSDNSSHFTDSLPLRLLTIASAGICA